MTTTPKDPVRDKIAEIRKTHDRDEAECPETWSIQQGRTMHRQRAALLSLLEPGIGIIPEGAKLVCSLCEGPADAFTQLMYAQPCPGQDGKPCPMASAPSKATAVGREELNPSAVNSLRSGHQEQLDQDGIMVGVSREALEHVLAWIDGQNGEAAVTPVELRDKILSCQHVVNMSAGRAVKWGCELGPTCQCVILKKPQAEA